MGNRVNIAGATFGRLTAITPTDKRAKDGGVIWKCKCECGRLCFVKAAYLTKGHTKSCGCLSRDNCSITGKNGRSRRKHGLTFNGYSIGDYTAWYLTEYGFYIAATYRNVERIREGDGWNE